MITQLPPQMQVLAWIIALTAILQFLAGMIYSFQMWNKYSYQTELSFGRYVSSYYLYPTKLALAKAVMLVDHQIRVVAVLTTLVVSVWNLAFGTYDSIAGLNLFGCGLIPAFLAYFPVLMSKERLGWHRLFKIIHMMLIGLMVSGIPMMIIDRILHEAR